ncbi:MAG: alginate export family protein [Planctomycetota bacterium]|nr:alginate export family protein [Planctomycetota bacterium]
MTGVANRVLERPELAKIPFLAAWLLAACALCAGEGAYAPGPQEAKAEARKALEAPAPAAEGAVPLPELTQALEVVKNIPVGPVKVSFGLDHRTRVEVWDHRFLPGGNLYTNGVTFMRNRFWMDWELHEHLRLFAMGQDARKDGDVRAQRRFWEDKPDLLEGFLDLRKLFGADLTVRLGRQPLKYGNERLVGTFEWSNPGRRFDGVRVFWKSRNGDWSADGFATKVVAIDPEGFNESEPTEEFYGLYAGYHGIERHHFEGYAFARLNENDKIPDELHNPGAGVSSLGDLRVFTHGFHLYGGKFWNALDYDVEGAFQWGGVGRGNLRAGALHAELAWTFAPSWKPRLSAEYNYGSGDGDPDDGDSGTFNNLFPTNHLHYGYSDYVNWSNTHNIGLGFSASPYAGITVWAKAWQFWLAEREDAWRNAAGGVLGRDRSGNSGNRVGQEYDLGVSAKINRHISAQIGFSIFEGGRFVQETRDGQQEMSRFLWAQAELKF